MASFLGPYYYSDPRNQGPPGFSSRGAYARNYMAMTGHRPSQSMPRFTPYTSSDESDDGHVVVRKKTKPRRKTQTPTPQATTVAPMDLDKEVVLTAEPVVSPSDSSTNKVPTKGRLKRYFSRQFSELKKEFNGPLTASVSSTTLDNVDELRTVQSSTIASVNPPTQPSGSQPHQLPPPTSMRHSKSVGDLHLHLPPLATKEEQGSAAPLAYENQSGRTLLPTSVDPSKKPKQKATQASSPDAHRPMIQMGDKGPSAARDMASLGFSAHSSPSKTPAKKLSSSTPTSAAPSSLNQTNKSPKSTMQRLEEKFASWFSSKKSTKAGSARKGAGVDKKKIIPTKSSSSSVSSTLLLDSSSSNENPKKPKKKRVDFVLVHKQVESLFHDKKPAPLKSGSWSFARLRENMSTSEITPAPDSGADRSLSAALSGITGPGTGGAGPTGTVGAPQLPPLSLGTSPSINTNNSTNNINTLHKATTSITSDPATLFPESDMTSEDEEAHWNEGYRLWKERRAAWLTPHPETLQEQKEKEEGGNNAEAESSDTVRFEDIPEEGYPMVYERLVDKTKTLKKPLNLAFVLKVMKAGWVATGQWPNS
ncbi:hypothetical protein B0I73DRAFT_129393 [Yarrowia lipolytica]|uniref:Gag1-like clamp domain-containing protein n=1 Tax=Yarrowia lipolytica TaxID=4952 RepID=A0A371CEF9_YARLL|nr:Hypothetical protein YALI2_C00355g [Yarrowia lipolytica]RDW28665.1 hypothetical protein B0I71DRAFT_127131 [Yarrowia lipolytica]RDW41062.1 hypothetical protein B0I73DRAFT_129393 [Yarrowia lipolytica]RDW45011.1 hypothetical protein B0I74DRAFT_139517 [Yarrowia lipolytica]RDW54212.1 hypothetical protein B0I75DRAFT_13169 [Yarrowia lipolytica]